MKWLVIPFLFMQVAMAETSKLIPTFVEAAKIYVAGKPTDSNQVLKPEVFAVVELLGKRNLDFKLLEEVISRASKKSWILPDDNEFEKFLDKSKHILIKGDVPEVSFQATRIDVHKKADMFFNDDVYAYFFVTEGDIPLGRVTSIYKGLSSGESFFLNESDRPLYPLTVGNFKRPGQYLVIDYGVIESGGNEIKKMQLLTGMISDIALAVYQSPHSMGAMNLRLEMKALADVLLTLYNSDRLFTGSTFYTQSDLAEMLKKDSSVEISNRHTKTTGLTTYDYEFHLRLMRNK